MTDLDEDMHVQKRIFSVVQRISVSENQLFKSVIICFQLSNRVFFLSVVLFQEKC